tara:strand:+ start:1354 stop:1638 length:285 start_codon:yes stop_codon:yes gene_type:complete
MKLNHVQVRVHGDSMWPTLKAGQYVNAIRDITPVIGDIVIVKHPLKNATIIKRIKRFDSAGMFIEGDNPDPLGSEDSHNFGLVPTASIIAIIRD